MYTKLVLCVRNLLEWQFSYFWGVLWHHNDVIMLQKHFIFVMQDITSYLIPYSTMFVMILKKRPLKGIWRHYDVNIEKCSTVPEWHSTVLNSWHHIIPESIIKKTCIRNFGVCPSFPRLFISHMLIVHFIPLQHCYGSVWHQNENFPVSSFW